MDIQDLVPAGGGSLRGRPVPAPRQTVATFTPTRTLHPDEIWSPRSHDIGRRTGRQEHHDRQEHADQAPHEETARMICSALRPGA
jgi:hypothetical protein